MNLKKLMGFRLQLAAFAIFCSITLSCGKSDNPPIDLTIPSTEGTFTNPLMTGADPWVIQRDGQYYYLQTVGNSIRIWKTNAMSKLASAISTTIYTPAAGAQNSRNVWAPELHYLNGKWYIYYTAGNGNDASQRTWVLENENADPTTGIWVDKGRIFSSGADFWAIDGSIMEYNGSNYFVWCGRPDLTNQNLTQNIYIAKMTNAWTLEASVTKLTEPELSWERSGFGVNEAPQPLKSAGNKHFIMYSASYCGTDDYSLGMLSLKTGGDPMVKSDWTKSAQPIFSKSPQNNAYGPGHNAFFKSPNGEDWIIYHANSNTNEGCADKRNIRIQKFTFDDASVPVLGQPVATGLKLAVPSGEK